jgi:hypothetical protein
VDLIVSIFNLFFTRNSFIFVIIFIYCFPIHLEFYSINVLNALIFFYNYPYIKSSSESESSLSVSTTSSTKIVVRLLFTYFKDLSELIFFIFIGHIKCLKITIVIAIVNLMMLTLYYNMMPVDKYNKNPMLK